MAEYTYIKQTNRMYQVDILRVWDDSEKVIEQLYKRPRINYRVSEYIFDFINEKLLAPKKVMQKGHYLICLSFSLYNPAVHKFYEDNPYNTNITKLSSCITNRTIKEQKYKEVFITGRSVLFTEKITPKEYASLIYDMYATFLLNQFRKITRQELDSLKKELDYTYIESFEYPASFKDQEYINDDGIIHYKWYNANNEIIEIGPFNVEELYSKHFGK